MARTGGEKSEKETKPRAARPSYLRGLGKKSEPHASAEDAPKEAVREIQEAEAPTEDSEIYSWKVWLLPRRPVVSALVLITLIGCILLAYWALPSPFFIVVITAILVNRLAPYLFPVKYILTEKTAGYKTFMASDIREWSRFFTFHKFPDGVLLSLDRRSIRSRLAEGLFLYYAEHKTNQDEILNIVGRKLKSPEEAASSGDSDAKTYKGGIGSAWRRIRRLKGKK